MSITYVKGDLFAANERAVAHGANCRGLMGAGVAKIVRERYPLAFSEYTFACNKDQFYPGVAQPVVCPEPESDELTMVYNLATQNAPGANARIEYVAQSFRNMFRHMQFVGNNRIAMPKIGAGIGGLEWASVAWAIMITIDEIAEFQHGFDPDVVVYEL